jgi:hypothetical protein
VQARWSSGKDEVLQVRKARIDSWLSKTHFGPQQVYALILCNVIYYAVSNLMFY